MDRFDARARRPVRRAARRMSTSHRSRRKRRPSTPHARHPAQGQQRAVRADLLGFDQGQQLPERLRSLSEGLSERPFRGAREGPHRAAARRRGAIRRRLDAPPVRAAPAQPAPARTEGQAGTRRAARRSRANSSGSAVAVRAAPPPRRAASGGEIKDCPTCPVLVPLSPGTFTMGSNSDDPAEKPPHRVSIGQPFAIGKYEVTVEQWKACVGRGSLHGDRDRRQSAEQSADAQRQLGRRAAVYVKWLSKISGKSYRLPTEAEWEYAARGGTSTRLLVGRPDAKGNANCKDCGDRGIAEGPGRSVRSRPIRTASTT